MISEEMFLVSSFQLFATPWTIASRLLCPWDSPGKNSGVGCHALLQGVFPTQGWKPHLSSLALADQLFTVEPLEKPNLRVDPANLGLAPGGFLPHRLSL